MDAKEASFGPKWNPTVRFFEVSWDSRELHLNMPFKADTVRFTKAEARHMKEALEKFLGE